MLAVLVALFLAPLLDDLPRAVLASMVMVAIIGLLSPADFWVYARIDRSELTVALVVAGVGLVGGMLVGVAVGVILTLALVVRRVNQPRVLPRYRTPDGRWSATAPEPASPGPATYDGALVLQLTGSLYTGNARPTVESAMALVASAQPPPERVVLGCSAVTVVTIPLLEALRDLRDELAADERTLLLAGFPEDVLRVCLRMPWFAEHEARGLVTPGVDEAVAAATAASDPSG